MRRHRRLWPILATLIVACCPVSSLHAQVPGQIQSVDEWKRQYGQAAKGQPLRIWRKFFFSFASESGDHSFFRTADAKDKELFLREYIRWGRTAASDPKASTTIQRVPAQHSSWAGREYVRNYNTGWRAWNPQDVPTVLENVLVLHRKYAQLAPAAREEAYLKLLAEISELDCTNPVFRRGDWLTTWSGLVEESRPWAGDRYGVFAARVRDCQGRR